MSEPTHALSADVRGVSHLAIDATLGLTDLVEAMHSTILCAPEMFSTPTHRPTSGIAGLVYASIRGITQLVGAGIDLTLAPLTPLLHQRRSSPERDALIAALNGVLGDYLHASGNPLTIPMSLRQDGQPLELTRPALAASISQPGGKILLLVHGLCLTDGHWQWDGHDHGVRLSAELGYTPIYLHYNTGMHISTNGRAFAAMLEALVDSWPVPVEELAIIAHSMGGLVSRSACYYGAQAGHTWLRYLRTLVFLGTPHHGAPLERIGNWLNGLLAVSPYTAAFARLGQIRSAGITDLRYGNLLDEDWADRDRFAHAGDQRQPVPLPEGVQCYTIAATTGQTAGDLHDQLLGDGLVPLDSALGSHPDPSHDLTLSESQQWIKYTMNHLDLLHQHDVYAQLLEWLAA